jgi:hypothetical protein
MNGANKTRPVFTRRARSSFSMLVCTGRAACWPSRVAPCPEWYYLADLPSLFPRRGESWAIH